MSYGMSLGAAEGFQRPVPAIGGACAGCLRRGARDRGPGRVGRSGGAQSARDRDAAWRCGGPVVL